MFKSTKKGTGMKNIEISNHTNFEVKFTGGKIPVKVGWIEVYYTRNKSLCVRFNTPEHKYLDDLWMGQSTGVISLTLNKDDAFSEIEILSEKPLPTCHMHLMALKHQYEVFFVEYSMLEMQDPFKRSSL